ncbi:sulfur carrier protein ThiS [bacterium]|nr:sulfur carrier protein ThiS [bacterium]
MQVFINGKPRQVPPGSLLEMLRVLGIEPASVVMEVNEEIAPRAVWSERPVAAGDRIEILKFVGGG